MNNDNSNFIARVISALICVDIILAGAALPSQDADLPKNLGPQSAVRFINEGFRDRASSLAIVKSVVKWGITTNKKLEELIWMSLVNDKYEKLAGIGYLDGARCLVFGGNSGGTAYYVFRKDRRTFYRITDKADVNDLLGRVIRSNKIIGYKGDTSEIVISGKKYYQAECVVSKRDHDFIVSCLKAVYPEWDIEYKKKGASPRRNGEGEKLQEPLLSIVSTFWNWAEEKDPGVYGVYWHIFKTAEINGIGNNRLDLERVCRETIALYFRDEQGELAECFVLLGRKYKELGRDLNSSMFNEYAGRIYHSLSRRQKAAIAFDRASAGYAAVRMFEKAAECCEKLAGICAELGDKTGEARALGLAGKNYHQIRDYEKAAECHIRSAEIDEGVGDFEGAIRGWNFAKDDYYYAGRRDKTVECGRRLGLLQKNRILINEYRDQALHCYQSGDYEGAGELGEKMAALQEQLGIKRGATKSYALAAGNYEQAGGYERAGNCYFKAGRLEIEQNSVGSAIRMCRLAVVCYRKIKNNDKVRDVENFLWKIYEDEGRRGFLLDRDKPGSFLIGIPRRLEIEFNELADKYGLGIFVPVRGIKFEEGIPDGEAVVEGEWVKIAPSNTRDTEKLFSALEKGFLRRMLTIIGGDRKRLSGALSVFNDLITAKVNACPGSIDESKRSKAVTKIKLITAGISPNQIRVMALLKDYAGLPDVLDAKKQACVRLNIDKIDEECIEAMRDLMKYSKDGIKRNEILPEKERMFLFSFYSVSGRDTAQWEKSYGINLRVARSLKRITLLSPDDMEFERGNTKNGMYLILPYTKKSIYMAADLLLHSDGIERSAVYKIIEALCKELTGRKPTADDINALLYCPWKILPPTETLSKFFNDIARAEEELSEFA